MRSPLAPSNGPATISIFIPAIRGILLALACTGVVFIAGAKLLDSVRPAPATARTSRDALRRFSAAATGSFVVDPDRARCVPVQDHRFHFAEIDAGPHDGADALKRRLDIECAVGILERRQPRGPPGDGAEPSALQLWVPKRRMVSPVMLRPVWFTTEKPEAPWAATGMGADAAASATMMVRSRCTRTV